MTEFVDGWILGDILGEGAYGEVRIVVNKSNGEAVAMKMIDLKKHPDAKTTVKKETIIHRMLSHPNIIQYFGQRSEPNFEYIFLEYASGGELFDRIEPDVGMPLSLAKKYFSQLILAVEYLHAKGVTHRDLKPENLLLDGEDNLKVTDFGLATVYRLQDKERCLDKKCGTLPYVAPEVLMRPYHAEPADIWSCGIILVALLSGELPWDEASEECPEYCAWKNKNYIFLTPWKKIDNKSLSLIKKILVHQPSARFGVKEIKSNEWFSSTDCEDDYKIKDKGEDVRDSSFSKMCFSQPDLPAIGLNTGTTLNLNDRSGLSFSQPAHIEDLLISSQVQNVYTQTTQNVFQKLVRRMTRFFVNANCEDAVNEIKKCLTQKGYNYRINNCGMITICTVDKRKMPLIFKATVIEMDTRILVDFRLSKGCGLEFKKEFLQIKNGLKHILSISCNTQ